MMLHSELQGTHTTSNGEGMTLQDLYELLKRIPRQARGNYLMDGDGHDVIGLAFAQSDQAEKWEFKVYIKTDRKD